MVCGGCYGEVTGSSDGEQRLLIMGTEELNWLALWEGLK